MTRELTCISCPIGCALRVEYESNGDAVTVTGNRCDRGRIYATEEILAPKRTVTATVALESGDFPRLPVKTDAPLPKELIPGLLAELYRLTVVAPVARGDTVLADYRGTGVRVVSTRTCSREE